MSNIETLQEELDKLEAEHSRLWKSIGKIVEQKNKVKRQLGELQAENFELSIEQIMELEWGGPLATVKHVEIDEWLQDNFKYLYQSGYYTDSNQPAFKICLLKNITTEELDRAALELNIINTLLKTKDREFGIMEYTLAEDGCYSLDYNSVTLFFQSYGHKQKIKTFQTLPKALKYINQHHYYR